MKQLKTIFTMLTFLFLLSCSKDTKDEPTNKFDWFITKSIYYSHGSDIHLEQRWNETIYNQTLEYVLYEKQNFEKNSTDYYLWKFAYSKIN